MEKLVLYIHGQYGSAAESEHYTTLFPGRRVIGLDYRTFSPWETGAEIAEAVKGLRNKYETITLIANSIGAFFAMNAGIDGAVGKAYFISPIVDMERLIRDMMERAGVMEAELKARDVIATDFGAELSWEHLCFVREHPIRWDVPTEILYGSEDALTGRETMERFAVDHSARLTVMEGGEHWFHTDEQLRFLDRWILSGEAGGAESGCIRTDRLRLYPASREQMEELIDCATEEELKAAYREMLDGALRHPGQWAWYAAWIIELHDGTRVGDLCFKGLTPEGTSEIGYGILEPWQGRGYATEAVTAAAGWALQSGMISALEAEAAEDNIASRRVLEKCGFRPTGSRSEEGLRYRLAAGPDNTR